MLERSVLFAFLMSAQAVASVAHAQESKVALQSVVPNKLVVREMSASGAAPEPSNPIYHMSEWNQFDPRFAILQPWLLGVPFQKSGFPLDGLSKDKNFPKDLLERSVDEIAAFCPAAAGQKARILELIDVRQSEFNNKHIFGYRLAFQRDEIQYQVLGSPGQFSSFVAIWQDTPKDIPASLLSLLRPQDINAVQEWFKGQSFEPQTLDYHYETRTLSVRVGWRFQKSPTSGPAGIGSSVPAEARVRPFFGIRVVHILDEAKGAK